GVYRYDPQNPLVIRAETRRGVVLDSVRFHLASGVVVEGFDVCPNPYYVDGAGKKLNSRRDGVHGDSVYAPADDLNRGKTNDPPGRYAGAWSARSLGTGYITIRDCAIHYDAPPGGFPPDYDPLEDRDRLYLVKFNQAHHVTIEDCDLYDGKNSERKPAVDLP